MALIEARGVSHTYNGAVKVLDGVDLSVERGEFVSVLGASGSGKTTLLSILGGIERPTEGSVLLDGADITRMKEKQLAVLRRTKLGFVFQFFNLAPYLTAEQNILVPVYLAGKTRKSVLSRLDGLLDFMGIADRRHALPSQMSGGEQQHRRATSTAGTQKRSCDCFRRSIPNSAPRLFRLLTAKATPFTAGAS